MISGAVIDPVIPRIFPVHWTAGILVDLQCQPTQYRHCVLITTQLPCTLLCRIEISHDPQP